MNIRNTRKGFTLIELLMVVAIIIILATIVIISVREATDRSKNAKIITSTVQARKISEDMYLQESDGYTQLCSAGTMNDTYSVQLQAIRADIQNYSGANPVCYSSSTSYCITSTLMNTEDYFCIDDEGNNERLDSNPCADANSTCR